MLKSGLFWQGFSTVFGRFLIDTEFHSRWSWAFIYAMFFRLIQFLSGGSWLSWHGSLFGIKTFGKPDTRFGSDGDIHGWVNVWVEVSDFFLSQISECSQWESIKGEISEHDSSEFHDRTSDGITHSSDDAVSSDMQFDFEPCVVAGKFDNGDAIRFCETVFEFDTFLKFFEFRWCIGEFTADFCVIHARNFWTGMGKFIGEFSVIGQKEKALGVPVESADGKNSGQGFGEQINDSCSIFWILKWGDASCRFMEQDIVSFFGVKDGFIVDFDAAFSRDDEHAHFSHNFATDFDASLCNQFFCMTSAGNTCQT